MLRMKRIISIALAAVLSLSLFTGCSKEPEYTKYNGSIWDSFDTIISTVSYHQTKEEYDEFICNLKNAEESGQYIFTKPYYIYKGVKL